MQGLSRARIGEAYSTLISDKISMPAGVVYSSLRNRQHPDSIASENERLIADRIIMCWWPVTLIPGLRWFGPCRQHSHADYRDKPRHQVLGRGLLSTRSGYSRASRAKSSARK